ncbi:MAG: hypothetical protein KKB70_02645 [Proteobacteria bacterium]|nr:hypothetical protein [Pseudomonadota bacterium]MBU1612657.1 hypothetical protein [Pseudomonadota bacterium]
MTRIPVAQVWFFRDIQRAFGKGVDPEVLIEVLLKFVLIAGPLVMIFVVWRYWDKVVFFGTRAYNMKKFKPIRTCIAKHLKKRVTLEVYVVGAKAQQFIGRATVTKFGKKRLSVGFVTEVPNALSRVITGKRIICYCKPFKVGGKRINSFYTYILRTQPGVAGIKSAIMYTPADYIDTVRRSTARKRLGQAGAVRVKLWGAAKKEKFTVLAPDFETVEQDDKSSWKAGTKVVNISAGGLKLEVHPKRGMVQPKVNEQVVLEVMILNPSKSTFSKFILIGALRNVARPPSGTVYLGIQFLSLGERTGSRTVKWQTIKDEVPEIAKLLG